MAKEKRFIKVYSSGVLEVTRILVDRKTGVNYLFYADGYSSGLTVLLNRDGTPVTNQYDE